MNTLVSIVIPCYNSEKFIDKTIESICNQTYKNIEILMIDDGSQDNSIYVFKEIVKKYDIKYKIIKQENKGVSAARNRGIDEANGKYIFFMDSDDIIDSSLIEKMINKLESNDLDLVFCGFDKVDNKGTVIQKYGSRFKYIKEKSGEMLLEDMLKEKIWICIGNAIYNKELILKYKIKFTEGCYNGEDQEFIYKFLFHAKNVGCIKESLFKYVQRENSYLHTYSLNRLSVLGGITRTEKYLTENKCNEKIISYFTYNKFQKEFIRNMYTMLRYINEDECLYKITRNEYLNEKLRQFRPITFSKYELLFIIKLYIYLNKYCK